MITPERILQKEAVNVVNKKLPAFHVFTVLHKFEYTILESSAEEADL
jgi:hypothetical protein